MYITLYVEKDCPYSHVIKIILEEKLLKYKFIELDLKKNYEFVLSLNSEGYLPILKDRDFIIYNTNIIINYLEERYPYPSLLPTYLLDKVKIRLELLTIYNQYYFLLTDYIKNNNKVAKLALVKKLNNINFKFLDSNFFLIDEISFADCYFLALFFSLFKQGLNLEQEFYDIYHKYIKIHLSRNSIINTIPKKYHNIINHYRV